MMMHGHNYCTYLIIWFVPCMWLYRLILYSSYTGIPSAQGSTGYLKGQDSGSWSHTTSKTGLRAHSNSSTVNTAGEGRREGDGEKWRRREGGKKEKKDESSDHHPFSMHTRPTFSECRIRLCSGLHWEGYLRRAGSLCVQCGRSRKGDRCV